MGIELLLSAMPRCVQHFGRDGYADEFAGFSGVLSEYLAAPHGDTVQELMQHAEALTVRRIGRGARLFDMRCFLCVYVCPAALKLGETALAQELCEAWCARFPGYSFELGQYEDIASGFRTKPFGFS